MRFFTRLFLPVFTVWLCLFPATTYAVTIQTYKSGGQFIPVTGTAAVALDLALMAGRATPWVGAAITGYQLAKIVIDAVASDGSTVPVSVLPSGVSQSTIGGISWPNLGWLKDANGVWQPPATQTPAIGIYGWVGCEPQGSISSMMACVQGHLSSDSGYGTTIGKPAAICSLTGALSFNCTYYVGTYPSSANFFMSQQSICPIGYALSGANCNLSNSSIVPYPSDGKPAMTVKPDGTGFALDPRDPDNAPMSTVPTQITSTGVNNGAPFRTTISPQTGGGLDVTTELQTQNADGSTSVYKQTARTDATGKVIDSVAANYPGSLGQQTATTQAITPSAAPANMPTDYNREATQLLIKNNLDAIKANTDSALVPADVASTDIAALDAAKTARDAFKTDIDALPSAASPSPVANLFQPFTPSACTPLSWTYGSANTMGSHTYTLDLCPWVPTIQRIGAWAMYLLTAAMLFQMFTRRPDGGE